MKEALKVFSFGLTTVLALTTIQSSASAYTFNFSADADFSLPYTASGFFEVDDTLGSIPGEVEFPTELIDYELNLLNGTTLVTSINPSNETLTINSIAGVTVSPTELDFSTATSGLFARHTSGLGFSGLAFAYDADNSRIQIFPDGVNGENKIPFDVFSTSLQAPVAVPFGVSADLSILILGGMYGASRVRKALVARR